MLSLTDKYNFQFGQIQFAILDKFNWDKCGRCTFWDRAWSWSPSPPLPLSDQVSIEYRETSPPIPARPPLLTSDFDCNTIYWLLLLKLPPSIHILLVKLIIPKQGLVVVSESFSLNRSTLSNLWQLLPLLQRLQLMLVQLSLCCLQFLETVLEKSLKSISSKRK